MSEESTGSSNISTKQQLNASLDNSSLIEFEEEERRITRQSESNTVRMNEVQDNVVDLESDLDIASSDTDDPSDFDYRLPASEDELAGLIFGECSDSETEPVLPKKRRRKNTNKNVSINSLCSTSIKRGAAFDSDSESEPEDEYASLKKEYDTFLSTKYKQGDIWEWLKQNKENFPRIFSLCTKILIIPAASAPSERLFSRAGNVITPIRSSLLPDNASDLIFLASNSKLINKLFP